MVVIGITMAFLTLIIIIFRRLFNMQLFPASNPKDPVTWPILGCQLEVDRHRNQLMDWLTSYFRSDHRTVKLTSITRSTFVTIDPANIEYILKTNFHNYPKGGEFHERHLDMLGNGILNVDGNMWKLQRKLISHQFSAQKLRDVNYIIYKSNSLKLLQKLALSTSQDIDIQGLILRMGFETILELMTGEGGDSSTHDHPLINTFDIVQETTFRRYFCPWWKIERFLGIGHEGSLKRQLMKLNLFIAMQIKDNKKIHELEQKGLEDKGLTSSGKLVGMISSFILHTTNDPRLITLSSDQTLRDIAMNLLVAGRDSIASSLCWFLYCMCIHQDKQERVFQELLSIERKLEYNPKRTNSNQLYLFQEYADFLTYEDVHDGMPYLHAALTETLRLYPPVPWDGKEAMNDDVLPDGTKIKAGNQVAYFPYGMARMTFLWGHDAQEFKPERWLDDDGKFHPQSPFKFTSFQAGPRICIGKDVAYLQMKVTIALLLRFFQFKLVRNNPVAYKIMFVMSLKHGLNVRITPRRHANNGDDSHIEHNL